MQSLGLALEGAAGSAPLAPKRKATLSAVASTALAAVHRQVHHPRDGHRAAQLTSGRMALGARLGRQPREAFAAPAAKCWWLVP